MLVKTKAIVLSSIKYQEKSLIVKCFTLSDGIKSYFVHNAFASKKSNQTIAYFQPLNILEIEASHKNKGTLERFKEIKIATPFVAINTNIVKSTIIIFISEILNSSIREEEQNTPLFSFLETTLLWLDHHDEITNFHLIFLLKITQFLGFYPDVSQKELHYFEMTESKFSGFKSTSCLTEQQTILFKKLIDLKLDSDQKIFSGNERQILLKILIDYYAFHIDGFRKPKSLEVLKEVFS
jgi:DNA repair protein RecO (recombination protein O)